MLFTQHKKCFACIENDSICLRGTNITGMQISDNDNQLSFNPGCTQTLLIKINHGAKYDG